MQNPSDAQIAHVPWQKSSWSGGGEANCVEVGPTVAVTREDIDAER